MRPSPAPTTGQARRIAAALLTVLVLVLLGSLATTATRAPTYHHYVAMGDSFTAAPFVPLSDIASGCNRSSNNYPHLVARALHIDDLTDRSCTGAQTMDLYGRRQVTAAGRSVPPQLTALSARTDLVTIGIGANNGRLYARMATVCRKMRTICPLYDERDALGAIVARLRPELVRTLDQVKGAAPNARVLLVGYPKLLPQHADCPRLPRFRPRDRATFRAMNLRLRDEMRAAAREAGVEFVDVYRASIGHDVCARHPWVQGRAGNRHVGAALHPLAAGQSAVARLVEDVLRADRPRTGGSP